MPTAVKLGIGLLGLALIGDVAEAIWLIARIPIAFAVVILFGGMLFAISRQRNWARIAFAACVFGPLPFTVVQAFRYGAIDSRELVPITLTFLQVLGVLCLFLAHG